MRLEWHQLERRLEHLRVRRPERQRRLLASLAASGQQTPIIVVAAEQPDRYLVIDGYQRIAALKQLGRDTVEAVVWSLSEVEALLLDRSMRCGDHETALEEGWLLVELEQRFGYGLEKLARRFDRSTSWVSRRMGLVELLPESVQQQVRDGAIAAHVAMKFLVPVARSRPEACGRMAEGFARNRLSSREAGQLYAAWRTATAAVRERLLDEPQLFLKTQREHAVDPPSPAMVELGRDLEVVVAIARRANRCLSGATVELDTPQCAETHSKIHRALEELGRLAAKIPHQQGAEDVEPKPTSRDSGTEHAKGEQARDSACAEDQPSDCTRSVALRFCGGTGVGPGGDMRSLPAADPGTVAQVQRESGARSGGVGVQWSEPVVLGTDRLCRRHGICQAPMVAAARYHFSPGEEMQHDTPPHEVQLGGKRRKVQTASAVLCYSHMLFFQLYPTFQRFDCKVFLVEALRYFNGSTERVMIDNTHVVVLHGTGRAMVPVPEMAAFAERFGLRFVAHELGDANRSARVERPFWFIERNFLAGRSFASWQDMNQQARQWCDRVNATYKKHLRAVPRELFAMEQQHLRPLPVWVPEVYRLHERMVDVEGYVTVNSNRYSLPVDWIGRRVEVRETSSRIEIQLDARHLVTHQRVAEAERRHVMLAEHRPPRGAKRPDPHPEGALILKSVPEIAGYVAALKQHSRKMLILALRQLLRMVREYPRVPRLAAVAEAARYGLYDLDRVERMILRQVARDYFLLDNDPESE